MRISHHWVIAFLSVSLAGVAIDAARAKPGKSLATSIAEYAPDSTTPFVSAPASEPARSTPRSSAVRPLAAALVLHVDDCSGNFRMFNLLHRQEVRGAIAMAVIWYAGTVSDSGAVRSALPGWMRNAPLQPVPMHVVRELARLGHRSTPVLLMLDEEQRLRLTTQSPRSPREFAGLQRIITSLTWSEER